MSESPQKKPMTTGKIILIVLAILAALGLGTCATCAMCVGAAGANVAKQEQEKKFKVEQTLKNCQTTEAVSWASIAAELKKNEAKVSAGWKDACAKVSGVVERIDAGFDNRPVVVIGAGDQFSLNDCRCNPENREKALALTKGQQITVWGIGGDEIMGSLALDHCEW